MELDSKKTFAQIHEACDVQDVVQRQVMVLEPVKMKKSSEEGMYQEARSTKKEGFEACSLVSYDLEQL